MNYEKLLNEAKRELALRIEEDKIKKNVALLEAIKDIEKASWGVRISGKKINKLYSMSVEDFIKQCEIYGFKIEYPLSFKPKDVEKLQKELDDISNQILNVALKYKQLLDKALEDRNI